MDRTIIYVFGPKRLASLYVSGQELTLENNGGWVKIGQTKESDDNVNKWDSAMKRVTQETHTGIPEVCLLLDVFEYPFQKGNADDYLRKLLAETLYELRTSKNENKCVEKSEIKAGREFVYGVTRTQIRNAFALYERNLILECSNDNEKMKTLIDFIVKNNTSDDTPSDNDKGDDAMTVNGSDISIEGFDSLWENVKNRINNRIENHVSTPQGRPYIFIKNKNFNKDKKFEYTCQISVRSGIISVAFNAYGGENERDNINAYLDNNDDKLSNIVLKQGAKDKEKWAWCVLDSLDKSNDELIDWFENTFFSMYKVFESYDPNKSY